MFHHQPRLGRDIELPTQQSSRRDFLRSSYNGLGMLALAGMLADELDLAPAAAQAAATAISDAHHKAKAKHCIFLFMAGGVSQMDTFDPKPQLTKFNGKPFPLEKAPTQFDNNGNTRTIPIRSWNFEKKIQSKMVDVICFMFVKCCKFMCMDSSAYGTKFISTTI